MSMKGLLVAAAAAATLFTGTVSAAPVEYTVGTGATYRPFEFQTPNKEIVGFDIDMVRMLGQKAGFTIKVVSMGFDALIPAILSRQIDIAGAAITITEERAKKVGFTQPYYDSGLSILVRKADKDTYKTDKDLKNKIICGQLGTSGAAYARTIEGTTVKTFNTMNETYMELRNKGCEAVIGDRPTIAYFMTSNARNKKLFTLQDTILNVEQFGFIVAKDNKKLLERLDKAFEEAKKDGSYKALLVKWFGQ